MHHVADEGRLSRNEVIFGQDIRYTPPVTAADNGSLFSAVVSNAAGSVTSNNATLTVR